MIGLRWQNPGHEKADLSAAELLAVRIIIRTVLGKLKKQANTLLEAWPHLANLTDPLRCTLDDLRFSRPSQTLGCHLFDVPPAENALDCGAFFLKA